MWKSIKRQRITLTPCLFVYAMGMVTTTFSNDEMTRCCSESPKRQRSQAPRNHRQGSSPPECSREWRCL